MWEGFTEASRDRDSFPRYVLKAQKVLSVKETVDRAFQRRRASLGKREKDILQGVAFSEQCCSPSGNVKLSKHMFSVFNVFIFHE